MTILENATSTRAANGHFQPRGDLPLTEIYIVPLVNVHTPQDTPCHEKSNTPISGKKAEWKTETNFYAGVVAPPPYRHPPFGTSWRWWLQVVTI